MSLSKNLCFFSVWWDSGQMFWGPQLVHWAWSCFHHPKFLPSRISSLRSRRRSVVDNSPSPVTALIGYVCAHRKLRYFLPSEFTLFRRTRPDLLTGIVLRLPTGGVQDIDLTKKKRVKMFPKEASPHLQTSLFYYLWRVVKRSAPIGSYVPQRCNFPGDIPPWFCWSWLCSVPIYLYVIRTNHVWTCRPQ